MERVKVTYTGNRSAVGTYSITPGGKTYTAQGYKFGLRSKTNSLLKAEAAVLANLDGEAKDGDGNTLEKPAANGKMVPVRNRELVTLNGKPLPDADTFYVEGAAKPATTKKQTGDTK